MSLYDKKLHIKKPNGVIQIANLYTDKSEVGNDYLTLKDGGGVVYAPLDVNGNITNIYVKKNGNVFRVKNIVSTHTCEMSILYQYYFMEMTSVPNDRNWYSYTGQFHDLSYMFHNCFKLTSIPPLDTSNTTVFRHMFKNCYSLTSIPQLDTSKAFCMDGMFENCHNLTTIPVLYIKNIESTERLEDIIRNTKVKHITFKGIDPGLLYPPITPQLLGKPDVTIHYV